MVSSLQVFNAFTNKRFEKVINIRIREIEFVALVTSQQQTIITTQNKREAIEAAKSIRYHSCFHKYLSSLSLWERLRSLYVYTGYYIYPIWKYAWKIFFK